MRRFTQTESRLFQMFMYGFVVGALFALALFVFFAINPQWF